MTNYPLGVTSKDFDDNKLTEPISFSVELTDLELDNGQGLQGAWLYAEATVYSYDLECDISGYYQLVGNNGEELEQVDYIEGKNLKHDLALIAEIERQFKKRL